MGYASNLIKYALMFFTLIIFFLIPVYADTELYYKQIVLPFVNTSTLGQTNTITWFNETATLLNTNSTIYLQGIDVDFMVNKGCLFEGHTEVWDATRSMNDAIIFNSPHAEVSAATQWIYQIMFPSGTSIKINSTDYLEFSSYMEQTSNQSCQGLSTIHIYYHK